MKAFRVKSNLTVYDTDPLVREHRVHQIHILPGVSMLDATYKTLAAANCPAEHVLLREILFYEPVVTHAEMDRTLTVAIECDGQRGQIKVSSVPSKEGVPLASTPTLHMSANLFITDAFPLADLQPSQLQGLGEVEDLASCYQVTRKIGIYHESFMQCLGTVQALPAGACLGKVRLHERAVARAEDFFLHPVFLDCSTIVPLFNLRHRLDEASLFIPFAMEEFCARSFSGKHSMQVLVEKSDVGNADQEILRYSALLFDDAGRAMGKIGSFGVKRVRSLDGINRLLASGQSSRGQAAQTQIQTPTPPPVHQALQQAAQQAAPQALQQAATQAAQQPAEMSVPDESLVQADQADQAGAVDTSTNLISLIGGLVAQCGNTKWQQQDADKQFFDLGLDSLALLDMSEALEKKLDIRLYPTLLFECPTVAKLADYLQENFNQQVQDAVGKQSAVAASSKPAKARSSAASEVSTEVSMQVSSADTAHAVSTPSARILLPRWQPYSLDEYPSAEKQALPGIVMLGIAADDALWQHMLAACGQGKPVYAHNAIDQQALLSGLEKALRKGLKIEQIWLAQCDHLALFGLIKLLQEKNYLQQSLAIKAITRACFALQAEAADLNAQHGLWGMLQSLSREYPQVSVLQCDLAASAAKQVMLPVRALAKMDDQTDEQLQRILRADALAPRQLLALRGAHCYQRQLFPLAANPAEKAAHQGQSSALRQGGSYFIVGGASGLGLEFAKYLRQTYAAKVALMGRRPLDENLRQQLAVLGEEQRDWQYFSGSVDDAEVLKQAMRQARQSFAGLHAIFHSAMVLDDKRLAEMDLASVEKVMLPKMAGMQAIAQASADTAQESWPLDFIACFSSMQSFIGNQSQANYAAASTWLDGYCAALAAARAYPVHVINWGFWSEIGAVATPVYRQLLARQGLYGLQSAQALQSLEQVLALSLPQVLIVAADNVVLDEMGMQYSWQVQPIAARLPAHQDCPDLSLPMEQVMQHEDLFKATQQHMPSLLALAQRRVRAILREIGISTKPESVVQAQAEGKLAREHLALVRVLQKQLMQGDSKKISKRQDLDQAEFLAAMDDLAQEQPLLRHFIPLLRAAIAAYPSILAGELAAGEALFPGGSPDLVRAVYGESEISLFYNQVVAQAVLKFARHQAESASPTPRPLRVLEIGAGTGSTTMEVMRTLQGAGVEVEYRYTDLWDKLVNDAKQRIGAIYPQMRFSFLDIGTDPALQGMREQFDVIIATNVIHATRELPLALRHIKRLLCPGGVFVMNESVEVQEYSTYTFGLLPGWWGAIDHENRLADAPLADSANWLRMLRNEGFGTVHTALPQVEHLPAMAVQQVFIAQSEGLCLHPAPEAGKRLAGHTVPSVLVQQLRPFQFDAAARASQPVLARLRLVKLFLDKRDHLWLFLDNAPANTFNHALLTELTAVLKYLSAHAPQLLQDRLVYLSHFGDYFSLGGDRVEIMRRLSAGADSEEMHALRDFAAKAKQLLQLLVSMHAIVIAVVNGTAQGGGLETLLATDLQLVKRGVKLGLPEIKSGLLPGMGGLTYLQRQIGVARTKRLVLQGELISADYAHEIGLISHVEDEPYSAAFALQEQLSHLQAALQMKKILAQDNAALHTADIDAWFAYLLQNTAHIDANRIEKAGQLLEGSARSLRL